MSILDRPLWQIKLTALGVTVLVGAGLIHALSRQSYDNSKNDEAERVAVQAVLRWHAKRDSAGARLDTVTKRVTITTHRLDTLWRTVPETLRTQAETVAVLNSLPVLRRATGSAIAACTDFQISCSEFRRVSDSLETALKADRDLWKKRFEHEHPSRFAAAVKWGEIGLAAWVGYRVGRR